EYLKENGHGDDSQFESLRSDILGRLLTVLKAAVSLEVSPRLSAPDAIGDAMFSNQSVDGMGEGTPEVLVPKEATRLKATHEKFRFGLDKDGKPQPKLKTLTYAEALFEAM